jgi:hypothetical protein
MLNDFLGDKACAGTGAGLHIFSFIPLEYLSLKKGPRPRLRERATAAVSLCPAMAPLGYFPPGLAGPLQREAK